MTKKTDTFNNRFDNLEKRLDLKFEAISYRLDDIVHRLDSIDKRIDMLRELGIAELHRVEEIIDTRLKNLEEDKE